MEMFYVKYTADFFVTHLLLFRIASFFHAIIFSDRDQQLRALEIIKERETQRTPWNVTLLAEASARIKEKHWLKYWF